MKKLLTIASVLFSTVVFAGGTEENPSSVAGFAILKKGETTFSLIYKGAKTSDVRVTILDARDHEVYAETIKSAGGFVRPYNFEGMREGIYTISITDDSGRKEEKVEYRSGAVTKVVNLLRTSDANKVLFTAAGKGNERITVNIFDQANRLVHTELQSTRGDFAQVFDLTKLKGRATFEIVHENGESKRINY